MKQSERVFKFLAIRQVLSVDMVKMAWRAARSAQDTNTHEIVFNLLLNMTSVLSTAHRKSLMRSLCEVPVSEASKESMLLAQNLVLSSANDMNKKGEEKDQNSNASTIRRGVNCLWSIMQDGSGASRDIASLALSSLSALLCRPELEFQREIYLVKCIEHISESKSVPQMMYMMQSLLFMYFEDDQDGDDKSNNIVTRAHVIEELDREHHLLSVLMGELESFKKSCESRVPGNDTRLTSVFIDPQVVREKHWQCTYDEQIRARLDFFSLILSSSSLLVTSTFAKTMWNNLIVRSVLFLSLRRTHSNSNQQHTRYVPSHKRNVSSH
jgi:hypothetical protein